jgi:PAS domain S-box-containing protein
MSAADADLRLAAADSLLLRPNGLDAASLDAVFGLLAEHRLDDADLYFQYSRSEAWSLEEGQVKSGSFNIDQGVGVRAVTGDKTAFAYSDDIALTAIRQAASTARAIARAGRSGVARRLTHAAGRDLYPVLDPLASLDEAAKVALLHRLEGYARALDPRVGQVMASLAGEYEVVYIARLDGRVAADVRPLTRVSLQVIVEGDGRREQGTAGGGGRFDYPVFYKDSELRYLGCNRAYERFTDLGHAHIAGKTAHELWPADIALEFERADRELLAGLSEGTQIYETSMPASGGEMREVLFHKSLFRDAQGQVGGIIGALEDVTQRKRAEEILRQSERRFRQVVEAAPEGIFIQTERRFAYLNPAAVKTLGAGDEIGRAHV